MKRVKKGYERRGEVCLRERGGVLRIEQLRGPECHVVVLSARECEALGITAALEDVPEPWERVRDAVLAECVHTPTGYGHFDVLVSPKAWRAIAARLGIKSEGEL